MNEFREWFDKRLDNAIEAAETQQNPQIESRYPFEIHVRLLLE